MVSDATNPERRPEPRERVSAHDHHQPKGNP
jgi:hypothetical protein